MAFRELAKEKNMSLEEFSAFAENDLEIDKKLDNKILKMAESGKNYVFEGQLPSFLLGDKIDCAILLTCDENIRIQRMASRDGQSLEKQLHETIIREESERQRFITLYQIDVLDPKTILKSFNLIIDTSNLGIETILKTCITVLEEIIS